MFGKFKKNMQLYVGGAIVVFFVLVGIFAPLIATHDPLHMHSPQHLTRLQPPSAEHFFGTDDFGRDIFSRVVHGARISLIVGVTATALGAAVGVVLGILSGYFGGVIDTFTMRIMDVMLSFPTLLLALVVVTILGRSTFSVILTVAVVNIPTFARIVRGSTLSVKKLEYIDAVRAVGAGNSRIIFVHILPNIMSPIIVQATLNVGIAIVLAAALSFLGIGIPVPTPEWGAMIEAGRPFWNRAPHMILYPGLMIFLFIVGINLFGDGLRDHFEPKKRS